MRISREESSEEEADDGAAATSVVKNDGEVPVDVVKVLFEGKGKEERKRGIKLVGLLHR